MFELQITSRLIRNIWYFSLGN